MLAPPLLPQANAELKKAAAEDARIIKMLLLGAGESGKSTIFKQMKIINKDGYSEAERRGFTSIVYSNTIQSIRSLIEGAGKIGITLDGELEGLTTKFEAHADTQDEKLTEDLATIIGAMWKHPQTQEAFERKSEFQLNDSAEFYFSEVDRLSQPGYMPTTDDILRSRVRTTGIVQSDFKIKTMNFVM